MIPDSRNDIRIFREHFSILCDDKTSNGYISTQKKNNGF